MRACQLLRAGVAAPGQNAMADTPDQGDTSPERGEARPLDLAGSSRPISTRESRVLWLLNRMDPDGDGVPELRPLHLNRILRETFGISATTATADIAEANGRIQQAIDELAPTIGGQIKTALTRIAAKAERAGSVEGLSVASATYQRLGKICGLEERSDATRAGALTDEQLTAALAAHRERSVLEMPDAELTELLARRAAARDSE